MASDVTEPNDGITKYLAEGQAGYWLIECLLLALVESGAVEKDRLLELIDSVIEAKRAMAAQAADPAVPQATVALLSSLANSVLASEAPPNGEPDSGAGNRRSSVPRRRPG